MHHRKGAPTNLGGIDVFCDFDWMAVVGNERTQFHNGQCLARRVLKECPEGLTPALLLTTRDEVEERSLESDGFYVVVVNLPRYLRSAKSDASASYFGEAISAGLTRARQLDAISDLSAEHLDALLEARLTPDAIECWATGDAGRVESLRSIVSSANSPGGSADPTPDDLATFDSAAIQQLKVLFASPDKQALIRCIDENGILSEEVMRGLDHARRCRAVVQLEDMLKQDLTEAPWQSWFEENDWVLGTEFVRILEERPIDTEHIADYLMEAYDGFLDLVEIKRPEGELRFWAIARDHGNYIPHTDLIKAITQAARYILEVEREANNVKFLERLGGVKAVKPRCVVIYGRSNDWDAEMREAYRVLNASYHNLTIMTFDHVLARAKRVLGVSDDEVAGVA